MFWAYNNITLKNTNISFNKNNEILYLDTKSSEISGLNSKSIVCYYFNIEKFGSDYIRSEEFKEKNTFIKNNHQLNWKGVYIYILKNGKKYIGQGDYIDRFNNHTKTKEWSDDIQKIFIFTFDQKRGGSYNDSFKFVESQLIDQYELEKDLENKKSGDSTRLNEEQEEELRKFINICETIYCSFNLFPFKKTKKSQNSYIKNVQVQEIKNENSNNFGTATNNKELINDVENKQTYDERYEATIQNTSKKNITTQNNEIFPFPLKKPNNTYTNIKDWNLEFFKLNQGITLTYESKYPIEIFIKEFKSNDNNTIIVKKGSYIIRPGNHLLNNRNWLRTKEDVFKRAKILKNI
ncbi:hypothetical protein [Mycoplasma sp. 1654_15]|uniref:hypothetical protein n=1 Tax=Mycoplasma sp. 1654_15 TaxID=2725994 RepID=UPI00144970DE|nr:hypothetical protein [Mycoplasma sp. 1654_15]QJB71033.1 hypothetical protein HF996_00680 [Mycoplasma sp. 1654_15]